MFAKLLRAPWLLPVGSFLLGLVGHLWWVLPGGANGRTVEPRLPAWDEGTVLYEALRVAQGDVMYLDFFAFQGPVFSLVNALAFRVFGFSFALAEALQVVTNALSGALLAVVVARLAGRLAGFTASLVFSSVLVPMWPYAYPHWYALLFCHAALVALTSPRPSRRTLVLAGALGGLALWTIQSVGLAFVASVLAVVVAQGVLAGHVRAGLARGGWVVSGLAIASTGCLGWFVFHGALGELWWSMFEWPFRHYRGINATDYAAFLTEHLETNREQPHLWRFMSQLGLRVIAALPIAGAVGAALVLARWVASRAGRSLDGLAAPVCAGAALAVVAPLFLAGTRRDLVHLAFLSSFGLVALAALTPLVPRPRLKRALGLVAFVVAGLFAANLGWKIYRTHTRPDRPRDFRAQWIEYYGCAGALAAAVQPGDLVVIGYDGGAGISLLHTGAKSAIAYTYLPFEWRARSDYLSPEQWARAAAQIVERKPVVIAVDQEQWQRLVTLAPTLADRYTYEAPLWRLKAR